MTAAVLAARIDPAKIPRLLELGLIKALPPAPLRPTGPKGGRPGLVALDEAEALVEGGMCIKDACRAKNVKLGSLIYRIRVSKRKRKRVYKPRAKK